MNIKYLFRLTIFSLLVFSSSLVFSQSYESRLAVKHRKLNTEVNAGDVVQVDNYLKVINEKSFTRNDSLYVDFQVLISGNVVKKGESISIIPEYRKGDDAYVLPAILINGENRTPYYKRERKLTSPERYWEYNPYSMVVVRKHKNYQVDYKYAFALPKGYSEGELFLKYLRQDCCDISEDKVDSLALEYKGETRCDDKVSVKVLAVGYESTPGISKRVNYIVPQAEKEKIRQDTIRIHINYPVDQSVVLPHFSTNMEELSRVDSLFRHFYQEKSTYTLLSGKITGYASPEAPYNYNLKLSERRAYDFHEYFKSHYSLLLRLPPMLIEGAGEDWDGLKKMVEDSFMANKYDVLHIIRDYGIFNGREKRLMDLAGGRPYRYMLKNLFPPLRRIELSLTYKVRSFTIEEAKEMVQKRPKDLSQKEIYDVAVQTDNSQLIEKAVTYFPNDITANINASSVALIDGDLDKAYTYLQKVWNEPKAFNNIGVYYTLKKEYAKAREFFTKALSVDKTKAEANLKLLQEIGK